MKIVTWNINAIRTRLQTLQDFISENDPDVILLQELKCETEKFPYEEFSHLPYNLYVHGQKAYNGVAVLSKFPADEINYNFTNNPCPEQSRFLEVTMQTPVGFCRIISLYAPNGGEVGSDKFIMKLGFFDALTSYLANYLGSAQAFEERLIIGGDFNIAPFDIDVYAPGQLSETTCFTPIEKQKMRTLLNLGLEDLYRLAHPNKQEFSWWDYRAGAFEHNKGMRIDTFLGSSKAANIMQHCYIDPKWRAKLKASDHAPVVVSTIV